ncbi:hypothetical protein LAWI1_G001924, partial [Lachnellula willkommii]
MMENRFTFNSQKEINRAFTPSPRDQLIAPKPPPAPLPSHTLPGSSPPFTAGYSQDHLDCDGETYTELGFGGPDVNSSKADSHWGLSPVRVEPPFQPSDSKSSSSFPEQFLCTEEHSSPLKDYPRTKRKPGAVEKKSPTVTRPPARHRNRKGPSRTGNSVTSANSSTILVVLAVNLPIPGEKLRALEATGDIKSLYISAFPGANSPRYISESELGQSFSYFGKTRLLRPIRPGRLPHSDKMAPSYRNQSRRQNRPVEHDIFEGLPVRQWRKEYITIAPPPSTETSTAQNDPWAVELPHGMPKDSHLLPQHSQDLLRAARSGKIYGKRTAPTEEEEIDPETSLGEKAEKKEDETKVQGYTVKTWKQIPRHMEAPDIEYLAKRRKNIKTFTAKQSVAPTLTKAKVKRTDATGAEYLQDVVVSHGQAIDGEIVSQTTIPDPNARPLDPYAAPTPSRKKAPIIRKRPKGPGRGRKKKPAPTSVPVAALPVEGIQNAEGVVPVGPEGVKAELNGAPQPNEDVEMGDGSNAASDDEDDEGEEGDDDEGSESAQGSPAKRQRTSSPARSSLATMNEIPDLNSSPIPPVSPLVAKLDKEKPEIKAGSPLKNVALATSTLASPIPSPTVNVPPPFLDPVSDPAPKDGVEIPVDPTTLDRGMQEAVTETALQELPPPPPEATIVEEVAAAETRQNEEEEDEMLLGYSDDANNAPMGGNVPGTTAQPEPVATTDPEAPVGVPVAAANPEVPIPAISAELVAQKQPEPEPMVAVETEVEESGQGTPGSAKTQQATIEVPAPSPV